MEWFWWASVVLALVFWFSGFDDLLVDLIALFKRLRPKEISSSELAELEAAPEKTIAIMVPAWRESGVIRRMLMGNIGHVRYSNYHFFVGVYPNDPDTIREVEWVSRVHSNVHTVINDRPGGTSKGQILNCIVQHILDSEDDMRVKFDAFLLHDAEDVIHPLSLKLLNRELEEFDFIQVPIFSFSVPWHALVAGTYVDEFAESHTKDLLVREAMGAAIPSAGVGTALSRRLVVGLSKHGTTQLMNPDALTEDYELGISAHAVGFRSRMAAFYTRDHNGKRDYVATREFFPKAFTRSVKQRTRWTIGIVFLGWRHLGWQKKFWNRYFLWRDRKGIVTNLATMTGYGFVATGFWIEPPAWLDGHVGHALYGVPLCLMFHRLLMRFLTVSRVYSYRMASLVPLRVPVTNVINSLACLRAISEELRVRFSDAKFAWAKTEHELPEFFGAETVTEAIP